jgi:hypothetical protein
VDLLLYGDKAAVNWKHQIWKQPACLVLIEMANIIMVLNVFGWEIAKFGAISELIENVINLKINRKILLAIYSGMAYSSALFYSYYLSLMLPYIIF